MKSALKSGDYLAL